MGLNENTYQQLEIELLKHEIDDEVEDILLELAELMAEQCIDQQEIVSKININNIDIIAVGHGESEAGEDELQVFIDSISIQGKQFLIGDYIL